MSALQTIFGSDAIRGATIAMNAGSEGLQKYIAETQKQGSAAELAKANTEGSAGALLKLQNAAISIAQQFGAALEPSVTALAAAVASLSSWFSGLSDTTKTWLSYAAMAVIAIGPMLKVYGALASNLSLVVSGVKGAISIFSSFGGLVVKMAPRIASAFTIATGPVGLIVAAVAALGGIAAYVYKNWEAFKAKFTNMWIIIKTMALGSINAMIEGLNRLLPDNMQISKFAISADKFVDQPSFQSFGEFIGSIGNDISGLMNRVTGAGDKAAKATQKLNTELATTANLSGLDMGAVAPTDSGGGGGAAPGGSGGGGKAKKAAEPVKSMADVVGDLAKEMQKADTMAAAFGDTQSANAEKARLVRSAYEELLSLGISPQATEMTHLTKVYENLSGTLDKLPAAYERVGEAQRVLSENTATLAEPSARNFVKAQEAVKVANEQLGNTLMAASNAMTQYAEQGGSSFRELANAALKAAAQQIRAAMMQATATQVAKALSTVPFPLNVAVAGAAGAGVGVLFNAAMNKLNIPALAQGGLAYAPTLAMVGDNPGARVNPEVIAPLDKLRKIVSDSGAGGTIMVSGAIYGQDMLLMQQRAARSRRRI